VAHSNTQLAHYLLRVSIANEMSVLAARAEIGMLVGSALVAFQGSDPRPDLGGEYENCVERRGPSGQIRWAVSGGIAVIARIVLLLWADRKRQVAA
jgi:hypothetical protein